MTDLGRRAKDASPRWLKDVADVTTRSYGLATSRWRSGPDFLVVGAKRGGTTSLFNYLLMHPGVHGLVPAVRGKKSTDYFFKEWSRGTAWYRSHFPAAPYREIQERRLGYRPVSGEASPYYVWDPRMAERIRQVVPQVRAIMLVRDPVQRAWSHYQERRQNGVEPLSFVDALAAEGRRTDGELDRMLADPGYYSSAYDWYTYRARGVYLPQIQHWCTVFPREQLLVLRSEDLYADTQAVFSQVCAFLGVEPWCLPTTKTFNAAAAGKDLPPEAAAELREFFAPHNAALEAHLGRPLGWD